MTDYRYSPQQALARDVLTLAVNGGITRWARVRGYTVNGPPGQVRAEGIDLADRSLWTVDLRDIEHAITKLIEAPDQCAIPDSGIDFDQLHGASEALRTARDEALHRLAAIRSAPNRHSEPIYLIIADIVFQVAVSDEVSY
jgi:hypothetical protein